jgi:nitrite reductase/ring-hydroxylating ferredoxin subunit
MESIGDLINEQKWLKPVETALDATAEVALNQKNPVAQLVRNVLHGTWLGHPLHPVITDVPIGAWSVSTALDLYELSTGDEALAAGADAAVGIGLIGAGAAAVAGLNDWQFTNDKPKRVGALHAIVNIGATLCYLGSWWQRRNGQRREGIITGLAGFCLTMAGAYLGGHLVYKEKIGVNHAPQELPRKFVPVMDENDLPEGKLKKGEVEDIAIVLMRRGEQIFALADTCSHLGGPLSEGKIEGMCVRCPWHGSLFSFEDGRAIEGPTAFPQPCFETRVRAGKIEVRERRFA